jgi:hypothetical protein
MSATTLPFPMPLAEKFRPHTIADFVGLDEPKRILAKFAANPCDRRVWRVRVLLVFGWVSSSRSCGASAGPPQ